MSDKDRAHCSVEHDYSCDRPLLRVAEDGRFLQLSFSRSQAAEWNSEMFCTRGGVRGRCKGFSFGSRRRMLNRLNQVSVAASLPQFVTMTLPDDVFYDSVGEFAKRAKVWKDNFVKRLLRVCPGACGFWRIEWKARLSGDHVGKLFPHFHMMVWGLPEREVWSGMVYRKGVDGVEVGGWKDVREAYVDCPDRQMTLELLDCWGRGSTRPQETERVGGAVAGQLCGVPAGAELRPVVEGERDCVAGPFQSGRVFSGSRKFVRRACKLEELNQVAEMEEADGRCGDWTVAARQLSLQDWASLAWYYVVDSHNLDHARAGVRVEGVRSWGGVMSYAAKYLSKVDAEFMSEIEWGRSWGIFNRGFIPWARMLEIQLDNEVGVRLRRVARHYLQRRLGRRVSAPYGITLYCDPKAFRRLWDCGPPPPF